MEFARISENLLINEVLKMKIINRVKMQKESIFLVRYFVQQFGLMPHFVFSDNYGILFFLPKTEIKILFKRQIRKIDVFRTKFTKPIYFISYSILLEDLIRNLFHHIDIKQISCQLKNSKDKKYLDSSGIFEQKKIPINIYIFLEDRQMPMALGKNGSYIHLINDFLKNYIGDFTIYLRSS